MGNCKSALYYFGMTPDENANSQLCGFHDFHTDSYAVICRRLWLGRFGYLILTQPIRAPFRP